MSSEIAIKVDNLSKCYHIYENPRDRLKQFLLPGFRRLIGGAERNYFNEFWALRDVSFELKKGESVGILGRNGSGKSTLLQMITGTVNPTSGSVETHGRISALLELGSGFNPDFTGRENVYLNAALQGFETEEIDEKFEQIASFADIGAFIQLPVKTYSSGMYARLAFSAAIHNEPEILIVDEILAVGDAPFQQKCIKKLYKMLDAGVSVLLVSHDAYQVRSICNKALLLKNGKQLMFDSSKTVLDEYVASLGSIVPDIQSTHAVPKTPIPEPAPEYAREESDSTGFSIVIVNPSLSSGGTPHTTEVNSGAPVDIEFDYEIYGDYSEGLSFVINLYREDGIYIFGTTTKMQGVEAFSPEKRGRVRVHIPSLPLVSGKYKWRVAVNDERGMSIITEAIPVCPFIVSDQFRAVGIVDIQHVWSREVLGI